MTENTTPAPTDAELFDFCSARIADDESVRTGDTRDHVDFARAVLARWGAPAPAIGAAEPFGYFRAEPFGWTDCAESDEGAKPLYEKPQAHSDLHAAAQALVDRWDTPKWKDADHTGAFIQRLREALAAPPAQEARVPLTEKQISKLWSDAHNDTSDRMAHQVLVRLVETAHGIDITAAQKETP